MDCIDLFKRAAMALQTDPRYLALDQARKANDNDENLQNLIGEFNLARMDADDDRHRNYADEEDFKESGFEFEDAPEDAGADIGLDDLDSDSDDE